MTLPCIVCKKDLESASGEGHFEDTNQPSAGTAFTTRGHYGSTVFDPCAFTRFGPYLELNVCDDCLRELAAEELILFHRIEKVERAHYTSVYWDPGNPEADDAQ